MIGSLFSTLLWAVSWIFTPIPLITLTLVLVYLYRVFTKDFDFWTSRGVPGPRATLPWGNAFGPPFITSIIDFDEWLYYKQGGKKFCGYLEIQRPVLFVGDPDLIRDITVKDFEHFTNRRDLVISEEFQGMLSIINGKEWKDTRTVMTPTFSASKLKAMHHLCVENAKNLVEFVREEMGKKGEVEMKNASGRFTMDNIASCSFGVRCNSFVDPNSEFASQAAKLFRPISLSGMIRVAALLALPKSFSSKLPDRAKPVADFFSGVVNKTIEYRERNGTSRKDFLQLLLETKDKDGNRVLTNRSIVVQSMLFFIAGYDTTATLMTFVFYCLARNRECQRRVQQEVDEAVQEHGGDITYDAVMGMTYLDRVMSETLRLYAPGARIERECSKEYTVPGTSITIPAGTVVQMPVFVLHRDPDHYPDPLKFDPDRFLPEEKEKRHPCTYIPFGSGPRNCIAMRFALFEAKVALAAVLREFSFEPTEKTPQDPVPLSKKTLFVTPEGGVLYLRAVPRL